LPPLRERDDILELANKFLAEASLELGSKAREISEAAGYILLSYPWPGNVRELRNSVRRVALFASDVIEREDFSFLTTGLPLPRASADRPTAGGRSFKEFAEVAVADAEREAIHKALQAAGGNKSKAARDLRADYKTLHVNETAWLTPGRVQEFLTSAGEPLPLTRDPVPLFTGIVAARDKTAEWLAC